MTQAISVGWFRMWYQYWCGGGKFSAPEDVISRKYYPNTVTADACELRRVLSSAPVSSPKEV